jgi:hypothetical protein
MGSAFLSSHCGLPGEVFTAASLAQKAADFLTGQQPGTHQVAA